ncbi:mannose-6-phosphate isomerase [Topomyia yanbarensis]|uniref:mannose-6-phosphate isomerase n=1 Tax=Topomyia yanbarensis TaxID=2498891 RepID=UPI00273CA05D|nr:mannose-6-phosphate isomerase [Topomyia yanbarensis]
MELIGSVKNYDWGKLGQESFVAKLAAANDGQFELDVNKPYAELWMGDHCSGPSLISATGEELGSFIQRDPVGNLGPDACKLSYLFKVLSIRKALSIQVHPDKSEAVKLHAQYPDIYKDPNHKPELAIALTDFQAMCGFRPYGEIYSLLKEWPELEALLGKDKIQKLETGGEEALRELYTSLMHSKPKELETCISQMLAKINAKSDPTSLDQLFQQLHKDFPNDVGLLSIYFLNVLSLKPGQAIYLSANVPHAYLTGDCIECMACSDNVVRAGLTPKFKDVDTLLRLISYEGAAAESKFFQPVQLDPARQAHTRTFIPSVKDFAVAETRVPQGVGEYTISNGANGCILLVCSGRAKLTPVGMDPIGLEFGKIVFVPARTGSELRLVIEESGSEFIVYQAMTNDFIEQ